MALVAEEQEPFVYGILRLSRARTITMLSVVCFETVSRLIAAIHGSLL
jgi:hypothetical protein